MNCGTCRFFQTTGKFGMCQRYPEFVMRQDTQWCGEYQKNAEPVVDDRDPPKRRGRPPKDDQTPA